MQREGIIGCQSCVDSTNPIHALRVRRSDSDSGAGLLRLEDLTARIQLNAIGNYTTTRGEPLWRLYAEDGERDSRHRDHTRARVCSRCLSSNGKEEIAEKKSILSYIY